MLKLVSMVGSDGAVTDGGIADLVLDYAMHLGRAGTTDAVTVPVVREASVHHTRFLLGPASQITVSDSPDAALEQVAIPDVSATLADLRERIRRLTSRDRQAGVDAAQASFIDFDDFA